jgi:hypothetical protein
MARRELTRLTWPLPWWVVTAPAVLVAAVSYLYVSQAAGWPYIVGARLSGMLRDSLVITGPVVCIAATWVAERFVNRRSPTAATTLPRASGQQGLRILAVIAAAWCAALAAGGWTSTLVQFSHATGGSLYYIEFLLFPILSLCFFVVSGFLIGTMIARWHAVLWSCLWCLWWLGALQLYYTSILPDPQTSTEFFIFPAPSAGHRSQLSVEPILAIAGWWLLVLAALTALLAAWYRHRARVGRRGLPVAVGGVVGACVLGIVLQQGLPTPFPRQAAVVPITCRTLAPVKVCLTDEQQPMLDEVMRRSRPVIERMGSHLPQQIQVIASSDAVPALLSQGYRKDQLISVGVGMSGARTLEMDIGTGLAGLGSCDPGTSDQRAISWGFALGTWIARDLDPSRTIDPLRKALDKLPAEKVLTWYSQHATQILACRYTGPGPT